LVHIAGSIGKKGYLVLPLCNDWRWQTKTMTNVWYPSVNNYGQLLAGQWFETFVRIDKNLDKN
jgi:hypothetical protein